MNFTFVNNRNYHVHVYCYTSNKHLHTVNLAADATMQLKTPRPALLKPLTFALQHFNLLLNCTIVWFKMFLDLQYTLVMKEHVEIKHLHDV